MKAFRRRFVEYNMLLIGIVLLLVVVGIGSYMYYDYRSGLRDTMEQVVEPLNAFSSSAVPDEPQGEDSEQPPEPPEDEDTQSGNRADIATVFYSPSSGEISVLSQPGVLDADSLEDVLAAVISQEDSFGTLPGYSLIYYRSGGNGLYKIALASTAYVSGSMLRLCAVLALAWVGAMLCLLYVSIRLSALAVRPMEEAMQREKQFVADASHDLKTPLSVILANIGILQENPLSTIGSQQRWIDSTLTAAKNMQRLIGEMLTLADAERAEIQQALPAIDLSASVTKAVLQLESVAYEKSVVIETDIADGLMMCANEDALQRIVSSLTENAIKYEPSRGLVEVRLCRQRGHAQLIVRNSGAVIPVQELPHIFERFYRGDTSRPSNSQSYGLGLAITRQLVDRMNGKISVSSNESSGTIFTVCFPLQS